MYGITDLTTFVLGTIFIVLLPGPNSVFVLSTASMRGVGAGYRAAAGVFVGDMILMLLAATGAASVLYTNPTLFMVLKYAGAAYLAWIGFGLVRQAWTGWFHPDKLKANATESPIDGSRDIVEAPTSQSMTAATTSLPNQTSPGSGEPNAVAYGTGKSNAGKPNNSRRDISKPDTSKSSTRSPFRGALLISLLNPKAIFFFISFFVQFVDPQYDYPVLTFLLLGLIVQICSLSYLAALIHGGAHLARSMGQHPRLNALGAGTVGGIFIWFGVKLADASLG
ncbi:MAG TPA: LysE family transporter [Orrella sp.]